MLLGDGDPHLERVAALKLRRPVAVRCPLVLGPAAVDLGHAREPARGRRLAIAVLAHPEPQRHIADKVAVAPRQREVEQPDGLLGLAGRVACSQICRIVSD